MPNYDLGKAFQTIHNRLKCDLPLISFTIGRSKFYRALCILPVSILLVSCELVPALTIELENSGDESTEQSTLENYQIIVDGATLEISSSALTIRQLLEDAGVETGINDEISPPLYEPAVPGSTITIVRITESTETIERGVTFERRTVRNETMAAGEPPVIIQAGKNGLEELTVRIVYRDGIESDRRITRVSLVQEAQEEILMIGVDIVSPEQTVRFDGLLAFINGSGAQVLRGVSSFPEALELGGVPDRRVFSLSPNGEWLLYTLTEADDEDRFNSLWLVGTEAGAKPVSLTSENILWADWNPARRERNEIAWSTGVPTVLSPGWEANNDLWLVEIEGSSIVTETMEQILQPYPATYGWWGGDYAWSPNGSQIGYSFANEIGVVQAKRNEILTNQDKEDEVEVALQPRQTLHQFIEYDTRSDWVWVPPLSWSPDGTLLAFTKHGGEETTDDQFDTWILHVPVAQAGEEGAIQLRNNSGIWSYPYWAAEIEQDQAIAWLRAANPQNSLSSSYSLWLADEDGSNSQQIFPAEGVSGAFSRERGSIAWSTAEPGRLAFVYDGDLFLYDVAEQDVQQLTESDGRVSHPSWAPYGAGQ
ncbi:MAG: Tol biopolymer transport system component [Cellvibrionaceae bacterium]|jgi:Tol biopolymer transport system component